MRRYVMTGCALAVVGALLTGRLAAAAGIEEKPLIDHINNTLATMRYLHKQAMNLEDKMGLVHASREVVIKQLDAERALYESELKKGAEGKAKLFAANVHRLERQKEKLDEFDFDKIFGLRIVKINADIAALNLDLEARMTEYQVLFGKPLNVNLDVRGDLERRRLHRLNAADYLKLD